MAHAKDTVIKLVGITKRFPGVVANDNINFELYKGEIHALLGENGAGKTTLMNILYGLYRRDKGKIIINGREVEISSPRDAIQHGNGMVHQHFTLVPPFNALENIVLGIESPHGKPGSDLVLPLKKEELVKKVKKLIEETGLHVPLNIPVEKLPLGLRQRIEILKVLYRGINLLILDEPTTNLDLIGRYEVLQIIKTLLKREERLHL